MLIGGTPIATPPGAPPALLANFASGVTGAYNSTTGNVDLTVTAAVVAGQNPASLSNGLNSNIATGGQPTVRLAGPSGAFTAGGFQLPGAATPQAGQQLVVTYTGSQSMAVKHEDLSSAAVARINTPGGIDVIVPTGARILLTFDGALLRWVLVSVSQRPLVVNAQDFSADPTGAVDATAHINVAIAVAGNKGRVKLPAGNYLVSGQLTFATACTFEGDGSGLTTITCDNTAALFDLFAATSIDGITVKGLTVAGNAGGASLLGVYHGFNLTSCNRVTIHDVYVHDVTGSGGWLDTTSNVVVSGSTFLSCGRPLSTEDHGLAFVNATSKVRVSDCHFELSARKGLAVDTAGHAASNIAVSNSTFANNGLNGCDISGLSGVQINGLAFTGCTFVGELQGLTVTTVTGVSISGNSFYGTTGSNSAMLLDDVHDFSVSGNTCVAGSYNGLSLAASVAACTNGTISGNTCDGNTNAGIILSAATDVLVVGNTGQGNAWGFYETGAVARNYATHNNFRNNSSGDYFPTVLTLATGANNDNALSASEALTVNGPGGDFSISGFVAGCDRRILTIINQTIYKMTLKNLTGSSAGNQIITLAGLDLALGAGSSVTMMYSTNSAAWIVIGTVPARAGTLTSGAGTPSTTTTVDVTTGGLADPAKINNNFATILGKLNNLL